MKYESSYEDHFAHSEPYEDYLMHYGVPGMKWGQRIYSSVKKVAGQLSRSGKNFGSNYKSGLSTAKSLNKSVFSIKNNMERKRTAKKVAKNLEGINFEGINFNKKKLQREMTKAVNKGMLKADKEALNKKKFHTYIDDKAYRTYINTNIGGAALGSGVLYKSTKDRKRNKQYLDNQYS